jgi:hypothetical protein
MKKFIVLVSALLIFASASAQKTFDNEFYFRFGYSFPSWKQFGLEKGDWPDAWKKKGFTGEIGTIFMLNKVINSEKMALGIDVDYLTFYWHQFSFDQAGYSGDIATLRIGSKVGPSFTFTPAKRLAFDIYVKADISWITATAFVYDGDTDDPDGFGKVFAVGFCTGFNVRYSILMLGFELSRISPKLEDINNPGDYLGNFNESNSDRTPLPSVSFTIGLSF